MAAEHRSKREDLALEPMAERLLEIAPRLTRLISAAAQGSGISGTLTITQLRALGILARGSKLPSQLARDLEISPATASEVVDLLVRRGLVQRGDRPEDRRHTPLALTSAGLDQYRLAHRRASAALEALLEQVEPGVLADLERGMETLLVLLRRRAAAARETVDAG